MARQRPSSTVALQPDATRIIGDPSIGHHQHPARDLDLGQPVRHHDRGAPLEHNTSSGVASGRPSAMFSAILPENKKASWGSITSSPRSSSAEIRLRSTPVQEHPPRRLIVEPDHELGQCGLAGAGRADHSYRVAGRDLEVQRGNDLPARP